MICIYRFVRVYIYIHTYTMYTHLIPKNKTNQIIKQVGQLWGITVQGCHWWPIMTWADYLSTCWRAIIWGSVNSWFFHGLQNSTWDAINLDIIFDTVKKMPEFAVSMMCFYGKSTIGGTIYRSLVFHFLRPSSAKPRILYIGLLEMSGPNIAIGYFFRTKVYGSTLRLAIRMTLTTCLALASHDMKKGMSRAAPNYWR